MRRLSSLVVVVGDGLVLFNVPTLSCTVFLEVLIPFATLDLIKVVSLPESKKAYVRVSWEGLSKDETQTGSTLVVADLAEVEVVLVFLASAFLVSTSLFSSWRHVGCFLEQMLHLCGFGQSLEMWFSRRQRKQRFSNLRNSIFSLFGFRSNSVHFGKKCSFDLQNLHSLFFMGVVSVSRVVA